MIKLTLEDAIRFAREAVEEKGEDFVYSAKLIPANRFGPSCTYAKLDESGVAVPDCIVGNILHRAGFDMNLFTWEEGVFKQFAWGSSDRVLYKLHLEGLLELLSERTGRFLRHLQVGQDNSTPWGEALATALEWINWSE